MTTYDFDKIVDRSGSGDLKHEVLAERYGRSDLLPLWVADMDFETPQFITDALRRRLDHSLFGYTIVPRDFWPTVRPYTLFIYIAKVIFLRFCLATLRIIINFVIHRRIAA